MPNYFTSSFCYPVDLISESSWILNEYRHLYMEITSIIIDPSLVDGMSVPNLKQRLYGVIQLKQRFELFVSYLFDNIQQKQFQINLIDLSTLRQSLERSRITYENALDKKQLEFFSTTTTSIANNSYCPQLELPNLKYSESHFIGFNDNYKWQKINGNQERSFHVLSMPFVPSIHQYSVKYQPSQQFNSVSHQVMNQDRKLFTYPPNFPATSKQFNNASNFAFQSSQSNENDIRSPCNSPRSSFIKEKTSLKIFDENAQKLDLISLSSTNSVNDKKIDRQQEVELKLVEDNNNSKVMTKNYSYIKITSSIDHKDIENDNDNESIKINCCSRNFKKKKQNIILNDNNSKNAYMSTMPLTPKMIVDDVPSCTTENVYIVEHQQSKEKIKNENKKIDEKLINLLSDLNQNNIQTKITKLVTSVNENNIDATIELIVNQILSKKSTKEIEQCSMFLYGLSCEFIYYDDTFHQALNSIAKHLKQIYEEELLQPQQSSENASMNQEDSQCYKPILKLIEQLYGLGLLKMDFVFKIIDVLLEQSTTASVTLDNGYQSKDYFVEYFYELFKSLGPKLWENITGNIYSVDAKNMNNYEKVYNTLTKFLLDPKKFNLSKKSTKLLTLIMESMENNWCESLFDYGYED